MAHHRLVAHPLVLRHVKVERVLDVTPRMRRVTVAGPELGSFEAAGVTQPAFATPAFDDHVKLIFATDGDIASALPAQLEDGIEWPPAQNRAGRDYTPRRFDPATLELDLDFVMHGDGPAASWAASVKAGDDLWFVGPKTSTTPPDEASWVVIAGDETALPAIGRFFEERPIDAPVRAVISIASDDARQELAVREGDEVRWIIAEPDDREALGAAVAEIEPLPGTPLVWAAAESRALLRVRRWASRILGVPKTHLDIVGYWHAVDETPAPQPGIAATAAPTLPRPPIGWLLVRAALRLGVIDALATQARSLDDLAEACSAEPKRLGLLVKALTAESVLITADDGMVSLSELGQLLADDEHERERFEGLDAARVLALIDLDRQLITTATEAQAAEDATGASATHVKSTADEAPEPTLRERVIAEADLYEGLLEEAEELPILVTGLPKHEVWQNATRVAITGPGSVAVAEALKPRADLELTIVEDEMPLGLLREEAGVTRASFAEAMPSGSAGTEAPEVVVTALALGHRTNAEAVELLRGLPEPTERVLLVERLAADGMSQGAVAISGIIHLASVGELPLDGDTVAGVAEAAGWRVASHRGLGWGIDAIELARADRAR